MKQLLLLLLILCLTLGICSCSIPFGAYIRNMSKDPAMIDVFLLDRTSMTTAPNVIRVSNTIIEFKSGFKKKMDNSQNVKWIDLSHFRLELQPHTTVDLSDMVGTFINAYPQGDVRVTVSVNNKVDTLMNGKSDFKQEKFLVKKVGLSTALLYHDIK